MLYPNYAHSALGLWQAGLITAIMGLCLPSLVLVIVVDWRLRPEHPDGEDTIDVLIGWASFALLPAVGLVLCAIPALDAHTRLLFGRRLEYRVTEKIPGQARFRGQRATPTRVVVEPLPVVPRLIRRVRYYEFPVYRSFAAGCTTAVTDSVFLVYRDVR
jgi:hypothetical protein